MGRKDFLKSIRVSLEEPKPKESEDVSKRRKQFKEELYKKYGNDQHKHKTL